MKSALLAIVFLASGSAFAKIPSKKVKCIADTNGWQRINLVVKPGFTTQHPKTAKTDYNGNKIIVAFYAGTQYEGQQVLTMELNGYSTKVYDPKESLYILEAPTGVKIQCAILSNNKQAF